MDGICCRDHAAGTRPPAALGHVLLTASLQQPSLFTFSKTPSAHPTLDAHSVHLIGFAGFLNHCVKYV